MKVILLADIKGVGKKDEVINLTLWIFLFVTIKLHSENKL